MRLCNANLGQVPDGIKKPCYDRRALKPGIVHIGVGNFHRAHQAWYLHRLMQENAALDWAILGGGVRSFDASMREKLLAQDGLTTLIELMPGGTSAEIIGSLAGYAAVQPGHAALIAAMADPAIRIVTLTVTEAGYYVDPATQGFDGEHKDIQHDARHPQTPDTTFGAIIEALKRRRQRGAGPFTILSCDNLQGNGHITRQAITALAEMIDPELAGWIAENCTFPNSMVDCIVPATGPKEEALVKDLGIVDQAPVTHENYRQWVIEDRFCAGRPELDRAGATFTGRVSDYETMKLRMLNAGHQLLANAGEILGLVTISDCMADRGIASFFRKTQLEDIAPHVAPVPERTPQAYAALIERRFANPAILDTTKRVATDGSSRHPGFILPSLRDGLAEGTPIEGLALAEALWARMCFGTREDGSPIAATDQMWQSIHPVAQQAKTRPLAWLEQSHLYGDLKDSPLFSKSFERWLGLIWQDGCQAALRTYAPY